MEDSEGSVNLKTFLYTYVYDPKDEIVKINCDGQRYTKSTLNWVRKSHGDCEWMFSLRDIETFELADGKITPIENSLTYDFEINKNG